MRKGHLAALLTVLGFLGCSENTGPASGTADPNTVQVTDPAGDTFGAGGVHWDVTALTISRDTGGITVVLDFTRNLISPVSGDTNAMIAYVDFDVDQDSTTGRPAQADEFRPRAGSTGMGSDYTLELSNYSADSMVHVVDSSSVSTGLVKPVFSGNRVTVRIPKAMIGNDDGYLNAAAVVGRIARPSDIIPENGALSLRP